ncbi:hypothetical protein M2352_002600 [Azospirillum fermentarium]|uniref:hypothetical protein n=1 Tax=Azospirillum fermentarium TaxID=1233114 RepID=UPI00222695B9|nr:hypothetical protein [Azospirillum fermentarium]MCW2247009.1 hypothetical protein [Azospirillum fermentarium]
MCATAQYFYGKPVGGMSQREMPVSLLPAPDLAWIGATVAEALATVAAMAVALYGSAARAAAFERPKPNGKAADGGGGKKKKTAALAAQVRDGLLADLDGLVLDAPARLAHAAEQPEEEERWKTAGTIQATLRKAAYGTALRLFDQTFPIDGTLGTDAALAQERAVLVRRLNAILHPKPPKQGAS